MNSNLLLNNIHLLQNEYRDILVSLLPKLNSEYAFDALDEIQLFWVRHIESVQLFLHYYFPGPDSYAFSASTYLDYDANEHIPFLLLGNQHIMDDPLNGYSGIVNAMRGRSFSKGLVEQISLTAADNVKIIDNCKGKILVLPLRLFNQTHPNEGFFQIGEKVFSNMFEDIDSIREYFEKCYSIQDIESHSRDDISNLVYFGEYDDKSQPLGDRFRKALATSSSVVDLEQSDAYNFFILVYGSVQQAIDVIGSCIEYKCIPYVRYPVALHYISLLTENIQHTDFMKNLRFKMSVAYVVHHLCDKGFFNNVTFDDFLAKNHTYQFSNHLFNTLTANGINKDTYLQHQIQQIIIEELQYFYDLFTAS